MQSPLWFERQAKTDGGEDQECRDHGTADDMPVDFPHRPGGGSRGRGPGVDRFHGSMMIPTQCSCQSRGASGATHLFRGKMQSEGGGWFSKGHLGHRSPPKAAATIHGVPGWKRGSPPSKVFSETLQWPTNAIGLPATVRRIEVKRQDPQPSTELILISANIFVFLRLIFRNARHPTLRAMTRHLL
jgi:hypothetical protein